MQRRCPPDDLGEADLLARRGQGDDPGQHGCPAGPRQARRRGRAEHGPQRVGPGVAEHGPLGQVLTGQGEPRTQRDPGQHGRGHRPGRHGAAPGCSRPPRPPGGGQQPARQRRDLDGAAGPQIEQVEQVGAPRDQAGVHRDIQGGAPQQPARGHTGRADPADLDRAGGHLAAGQGAKVTAESPPVAAARQVVVTAEGPGSGCRGHQRQPGPARKAGGERSRKRGACGGGWSLEQGDWLAAVIGPGPGRGAARGPRPQHGVRAARRPGRQDGADHARGAACPGSLPHRGLADAPASGCADVPAVRFRPGACLTVEVAAVDGDGVGAGLGPAVVALASDP